MPFLGMFSSTKGMLLLPKDLDVLLTGTRLQVPSIYWDLKMTI